MREIILRRIELIKESEFDFKSDEWIANYVSFTNGNVIETNHISKLDFNNLVDNDLVRIFEYIILSRNNIIRIRVNS
jgi:hypothetical protein